MDFFLPSIFLSSSKRSCCTFLNLGLNLSQVAVSVEICVLFASLSIFLEEIMSLNLFGLDCHIPSSCMVSISSVLQAMLFIYYFFYESQLFKHI